MNRWHALLSTLAAGQALAYNTPPPFYGSSASGKTSGPRGWNSFVAQSNGATLNVGLADSQCSFYYNGSNPDNIQEGYDYVCGFDSGWSVGGNGDDNGRIIPEPTVFDTMSIQDFASKLHSNGMKLGVYMIPGAFSSDANKTVEGTDITIGSLFNNTNDGRTGISNSYNARNDFDYSKDGVQQWHDSVVKQFASWGVDFVKLDYVTPGSDYSQGSSDTKPANDSGTVACMHQAISKYAPDMRLDISWRLEREEPYWTLWQQNADTLRLDRDINSGKTGVSWGPVQRTIETYRQFINQQALDGTRQNKPIMIRPDMDNLMVAAPSDQSSWSSLSTIERYGQAITWIGAGANLISGADMTKADDLGKKLLADPEVLSVAAFTANWPMVPKNPQGSSSPGAPDASQLQSWIAGPDESGNNAVVILQNLGPDICWDACTFNQHQGGDQEVTAKLDDLGIGGGSKWFVRRVLGGGGRGGPDNSDIGVMDDTITSWLSEHESVMYKLTKCGSSGAPC